MAEAAPITLALTGASGAPYGLRLLECLLKAGHPVYGLISAPARVVLATETDLKLPPGEAAADFLCERLGGAPGQLRLLGRDQWLSPVASGSSAPRQMVICPCSMGTLARVAQGSSDHLIERAADVVLKERGRLILVVRETPFSSLHLRNMLQLSEMGALILPAAPGFYHRPQQLGDLVDFVVARILDHLGIAQDLLKPWGYGAPD